MQTHFESFQLLLQLPAVLLVALSQLPLLLSLRCLLLRLRLHLMAEKRISSREQMPSEDNVTSCAPNSTAKYTDSVSNLQCDY